PPGCLAPLGLPPVAAAGTSPEGGDRDDRAGRRAGAERTGERALGEGEDATVLADHEVAVAVADHAPDGLVQAPPAHRAPEGGVEGEHPSVRSDEPVPRAGLTDGDADDGLVERLAAHRPGEAGIAEGEDAAVG